MGDALPAVGSEDAAERFATFDDMHTTTRGCESADSGWCAPVGDDVARIDQADVAGMARSIRTVVTGRFAW